MTIHIQHTAATADQMSLNPLAPLPTADLMRRRAELWPLDGFDITDEECDALTKIKIAVDDAILSRTCRSSADLTAKLAVWADLIADPACILDEHVALFADLQRDVMTMTRAA